MRSNEHDSPADVGTAATTGESATPAPAEEESIRERARSQGRAQPDLNMGGSETHQRPSFSDPIPPGDPDRVADDRDVPARGAPDAARS